MNQLEKTQQILKMIRIDLIEHNRAYIGKVKRYDAIEAITRACVCIDAIIRYNKIREDEDNYASKDN